MDSGSREALRGVLGVAQERGLVGPGSVEVHIEHALRWADLLPAADAFLDLGSGGGVPGLVVALVRPSVRATLLDARRRSAVWLAAGVERLDLGHRVQVVCERAEVAAREPVLRERFPLVLARGFGPPATTAECGSGFVRVGGTLSASEPPEERADRWPEPGLAELGLGPAARVSSGEACFVMIPKTSRLDDRWPRREGRPHRRPLW